MTMVTFVTIFVTIFILGASWINYYASKQVDVRDFRNAGIEITGNMERIVRQRALTAAFVAAVPPTMIYCIWLGGPPVLDIVGFLIMVATSLMVIGVQVRRMRA